MVIQRWQSLYLLVASVMMGFYCFLPMANTAEGVMYAYNIKPYLVVNVLIALLLFISIFLYRNLSKQKTVVKVNLLLMVISAVSGGLIVYNYGGATINLSGAVLLILASIVITILAYTRILSDEKLLKSYDRIR